MATYDENTNFANERTYLNNQIAGGGGNAVWAKDAMKALDAAEAKYSTKSVAESANNNNTTAGTKNSGGGNKTGGSSVSSVLSAVTGGTAKNGNQPIATTTPTLESYYDVSNYNPAGSTSHTNNKLGDPSITMRRNEQLAGQTRYINGYNVKFNDLGYAVSATKVDKGEQRAPSIDAAYPENDRSGYGGNEMDKLYMSNQDLEGADYWRKMAENGQISWEDANAHVNAMRQNYGYTADANGLTPTMNVYKDAITYLQGNGATEQNNAMLSDLEKELYDLYATGGAMDEAAKAEAAAKAAAIRNAIERMKLQRQSASDSYDAMQRQLYINRERDRKNIQQQMAAAGLTGGAAESTMLGLNTAYEEGLRQGEQERAKLLSEIDQGIAETEMNGNLEAAELLAERTRQRTDSYAAALQALIAQQDARQQQARIDAQNAQSRAYTLALQMLQSGQMPSSDILTQAGLDSGTAQQLMATAESVPENYTSGQFEIALNAAVNGSRDDSVRKILEGYSGMPMETVLAAYGYAQNTPQTSYAPQYTASYTPAYTPQQTPKEETSNRGTIGYDEDEGIFTWNGKRYSSIETLQNALNSANLTSAEEAKLKRALSMYGFNA